MNDSRQVLGLQPEPGPQPVETPAPSPLARLALRLWTPTRSELSWASESPVTHLITDLICASDGTLVLDTSGMVAQFRDPVQAFKAAKRIQGSLVEFCRHCPNLCLGVAAVIYDPSECFPGLHGIPSQDPAALLEQAKPAQILGTGNASNQLRRLPGLELREFPSRRHGSAEWRELQELLWTSSANLERVQEALKSAARRVGRQDEQAAASEPTADLSFAGAYRAAPPPQVRAEPPLVSEPGRDGLLPEFVEREPSSEGIGSQALWWSLAAVGVLGILLAAVLLPRLRTRPVVLERPMTVPTAPVTEPGTVKEESPPPSEPRSENVPASPPKSSGDQKMSARHPASDQQPHGQSKKAAEYEGLTEKDIPLLLRMAEKHAGAGNYEDARREFNIVLHLDANNAEAKQGLRKLELSERESR